MKSVGLTHACRINNSIIITTPRPKVFVSYIYHMLKAVVVLYIHTCLHMHIISPPCTAISTVGEKFDNPLVPITAKDTLISLQAKKPRSSGSRKLAYSRYKNNFMTPINTYTVILFPKVMHRLVTTSQEHTKVNRPRDNLYYLSNKIYFCNIFFNSEDISSDIGRVTVVTITSVDK